MYLKNNTNYHLRFYFDFENTAVLINKYISQFAKILLHTLCTIM